MGMNDTEREEQSEATVADRTNGEVDAGPEAATDQSVSDAEARVNEFEDRWKRAAAEFQNYRRRAEQERLTLLRTANAALIIELLPVLDDLERALASAPETADESEWVKGTRLVERKFRQILERQGVKPIESIGAPFDPKLHEAIGGSGDTVTTEYQRGYTFHERVLRPSMVIVGPAGEAQPED